jgi:MazG family protein
MQEIQKLLEIMEALRDPKTGCPWDVEQDFKSIAAYTVEEAYEVADAIERGDMHDLKDELGDLLFQVVFHSHMASEQKEFSFEDVAKAISDKLVRRHPHVFADDSTSDKHQLMAAWEQHKKKERQQKDQTNQSHQAESLLAHVASTMPALRWAEKLQKRAARGGFDWDQLPPVYAKLEEELDELRHEVSIKGNHDRIAEEMGDLLFSCVNLSRHLGVNPEQALRDANRKFIERFQHLEKQIAGDGKVMEQCSLDELEDYWQQAKL